MTITILGANGRLGGVLHRHAAAAGLAWRGQTRDDSGDICWSGRVTDTATPEIFQPGATLINMIGSTSPDADDLHATNVQFVKDLLRHAANTGVAHVILASSGAVYGDASTTPLTEDTPLRPQTPYGISKAEMEAAAHAAPFGDDLPAITLLRIGNVAGSDALLAAAQRHAMLGKPMPLHRFPNGAAPMRSYIGPQDLFNAVNALSKPHDGPPITLNIAAPNPVPLDRALDGYKAHLLQHLTWVDAPAPSGIPATVHLSTSALDRIVEWPEIDDYALEMARQVAMDQTQ